MLAQPRPISLSDVGELPLGHSIKQVLSQPCIHTILLTPQHSAELVNTESGLTGDPCLSLPAQFLGDRVTCV